MTVYAIGKAGRHTSQGRPRPTNHGYGYLPLANRHAEGSRLTRDDAGEDDIVAWINKRGGRAPANALLDRERIDFIMYVNNKSKRRLSIRRLAKACKREAENDPKYAKYAGDKWSKSTLADHLYRMGEYWHRRYIEPYVTVSMYIFLLVFLLGGIAELRVPRRDPYLGTVPGVQYPGT